MDWVFLDRELIDSFRKRQVILFVGAGLSKNVLYKTKVDIGKANKPQWSLPNWPEMLCEMLNWTVSQPSLGIPPNNREIKKLIAQKQFLVAAQELLDFMRARAPNELKLFLNRLFNENQLDISSPNVSDVHDLLPKLTLLRAIVTTNYDKLIETAYDYQKQPIQLIQKDEIGKIPLPLRLRDNFFVFKMHGQYDRDIILGTRDYQEAMFNIPGYRQFIETLFTVNTILFVGYSGDDPNLNSILDRMSAIYSRQYDTHFILMKRDEMKNQTARNRLEQDKRVRVIEYDDYPAIESLLKTLIQLQGLDSQAQLVLK